jgi:hypothetical protein
VLGLGQTRVLCSRWALMMPGLLFPMLMVINVGIAQLAFLP